MRLMTTLAAAAVATTVAGSAVAGGFATTVTENQVVIVEPDPVVVGSLPGWVIPAAIAGVIIAVATNGGS